MELALLTGIFTFLILSAPIQDCRHNKKKKQLDRIERKLDDLLARNYKVDNEKAFAQLMKPVSLAKKKKLSEKEKKARKKEYMKQWYQNKKLKNK